MQRRAIPFRSDYDASRIWVAEYSIHQKCWHIDTLDRSMSSNRSLVERGICNGYVPLAIGTSSADVRNKIKELKNLLFNGKHDHSQKDDNPNIDDIADEVM